MQKQHKYLHWFNDFTVKYKLKEINFFHNLYEICLSSLM